MLISPKTEQEMRVAKNGYCSRDIYLQLEKVCRSVMMLVIIHNCSERAVFIGCYERVKIAGLNGVVAFTVIG